MFYVAKIDKNTDNLTIEQKPLESGAWVELNCIAFDESGVNFDDISQTVLDGFIAFLQSSVRVRINISASKKMNTALKNYIVKSGIREDRLSFTESSDGKIIYTIK